MVAIGIRLQSSYETMGQYEEDTKLENSDGSEPRMYSDKKIRII